MAAGIALGIVAGLVIMRQPPARVAEEKAGAAAPAPSGPSFTDVTEQAGIRFRHTNGHTAGKPLYPEIMGSGVALFDYDTDGDLDIFLANGNSLAPPLDPAVHSVLYRNDGNGAFTDVTAAAGVGDAGYDQGVCTGDFDADGDPDLYVTVFGANRLYRNEGAGRFREVAKSAGVADTGWGQGCAFFDYDGDGRLDLYAQNYITWSPERQKNAAVVIDGQRVPDYAGPQDFEGQASRLYRNRGDGTFEDTTERAGVLRRDGKGMGLGVADFDDDGDTDIFVANDGMENFFFANRGDGRFEETGFLSGVAVGGDGFAKSSMGVDVGDFDADVRLDLVTPTLRREVFSLFRNTGQGFADVSWERGLAEGTAMRTGFSAHLFDADNDADLDLFFTNGGVKVAEDARLDSDYDGRYGQPDTLLVNDGAGQFKDVSASAGRHFARKLIGRGSAAGDLDNDGDLDLVVNNLAGPAVVLRNDTRGHWLTLVVRGRDRQWRATGATVMVAWSGRKRVAVVQSTRGYLSASDDRLHFGLGAATKADRIVVRWPDGTQKELRDVAADQFLEVTP
jgi:hypothetical protein